MGYVQAQQMIMLENRKTVVNYLKLKNAFSRETSTSMDDSIKAIYLKYSKQWDFINQDENGNFWLDEDLYLKKIQAEKNFMNIFVILIFIIPIFLIIFTCIAVAIVTTSATGVGIGSIFLL